MDRTCDQSGGSEKNREYLGDIMRSPQYEILHLIIQGKLWEQDRLEGKEYPGLETCETGLTSRYLSYLRQQLPKLK
ncbi:hypothetical protein Trydic_g18854 [Trypoxylus dichotomus]